MANRAKSGLTAAERIMENVSFLAEVFKDYRSDELPDVPFLELARSFELERKDD